MRLLCVCLALFCLYSQAAWARFPGRKIHEVFDFYQNNPADRHVNAESILGWHGSPPLTGRVYSVETRQYRVRNPYSVDPVACVYREYIHFSRDGGVSRHWREFLDERAQGAGAAVTEPENTGALQTVRDSAGRVERIERLRPDGRRETTLRFSYGPNLIAMVDEHGVRTTVIYDGAGRPVAEETAPDARPDRPSRRVEANWDVTGKPLLVREISLTMPETVTRWTYDGSGRITGRETRQGIGQDERILSRMTVGYDDQGRCVSRGISVLGRSTANTHSFDQQGRIIALERIVSDEAGTRRETLHFTYDAAGNWIRCIVDSPQRPSVVERDIAYYPD